MGSDGPRSSASVPTLCRHRAPPSAPSTSQQHASSSGDLSSLANDYFGGELTALLAWSESPRNDDKTAAALGLRDLKDVDESVQQLQRHGSSRGGARGGTRDHAVAQAAHARPCSPARSVQERVTLMGREPMGRPGPLDEAPIGVESLLGNPSSMTDAPAGVSEHEKSLQFSRGLRWTTTGKLLSEVAAARVETAKERRQVVEEKRQAWPPITSRHECHPPSLVPTTTHGHRCCYCLRHRHRYRYCHRHAITASQLSAARPPPPQAEERERALRRSSDERLSATRHVSALPACTA